MSKNWNELAERMAELKDLSSVIGLLSWDQETVMPAKAGGSRAEQTATLQAILHERLSHPRLGELLDSLSADASLSAAQKASVRNLTFERNRATKLPVGLVRELAETQSRSVEAWRSARAAKKFSEFAPFVEKLLKIRQQQADLWGHSGERYDALLQGYEPGMTTARLEPLFANLRQKLVPLVKAIAHAEKRPDAGFVKKSKWSVDKQWKFSMTLLEAIGFDLEAGRQDRSAHPFSSGANIWDVRLTNRFDEADPLQLHLQRACTRAATASTSRASTRRCTDLRGRRAVHGPARVPVAPLGEPRRPQLCRSGRTTTPEFRELFGRELEGVERGAVHARGRTLVQPSFIRVEADEVTYNLHILLRFELELALHPRRSRSRRPARRLERADEELAGHRAAGRRRGRAPGHPLVVGRVRLLPHVHAGQPLQRVLDGGRGEGAAQALERGGARQPDSAARLAARQRAQERLHRAR